MLIEYIILISYTVIIRHIMLILLWIWHFFI